MNTDSGRTVSVWAATVDTAGTSNLPGDMTVDVCIVGGGIAGIALAYQLTREGKKVAVLDDGPIGGGETCRTTAHLTFYGSSGNRVGDLQRF